MAVVDWLCRSAYGRIVHAADVCEAVGARLCTLAEVVEANVAWAGCEKDIGSPVHFTWTSSLANAAGSMSLSSDEGEVERNVRARSSERS